MAYITKPSSMSRVWAATGVKIEPSTAKVAAGWVVEMPPYQFDNWLNNRQDTFNAHVNQTGIPHWDVTTEYIGNRSYTQGSDGVVYRALVTNTNIDPSNPINSTQWAKAFEDFGSVAVVSSNLATHVANYGTLAGLTNPVTARVNLAVYSIAQSDTRFAALAGNGAQTFTVANATANGHAINKGQLDTLIVQATETTLGTARLATQTDMNIGTNDTDMVTPLKGTTTFLRRDRNLVDVTSVSTARANLGLTTAATTPLASLALKAENLSGLADISLSRTNLGLGTAAVENTINLVTKAGNLSGLASLAVSRANLGLGTMAVAVATDYLAKAENLAGLANVVAARGNLGLGTAATTSADVYLIKADNLASLPNKASARSALDVYSTSETASLIVGIGQSWQPAANPVANVVRQNLTGKPIMVGLSQNSAVLNVTLTYTLNEFTMVWLHAGAVSGICDSVHFLVPHGSTYSVNIIPSVWIELR